MKNLPAGEALQHASDKSTTPEHLHQLAQHVDHDVKSAVAENPHTQEATLQHLHDHADTHEDPEALKNDILKHPNVPAKVINDHIKATAAAGGGSRNSLDNAVTHPKAYPDVVNSAMHGMIEKHMAEDPEHLPFNVKWAAKRWMEGPHATDKDVGRYATHGNNELADTAAESGKLSGEDAHKYIQRKDTTAENASDLIEKTPHLDEGHINAIHDKFFGPGAKKKKGDDYQEHWKLRTLKEKMLEHPSVPVDKLQAEIAAKDPDGDRGSYSYSNSPRRIALSHPKVDAAQVNTLARSNKDMDAVHSALHREDSDAGLIQHLYEKHGQGTKKTGLNETLRDDIVKHPNFKEDLAKPTVNKDTGLARGMLNKPNLSEDMLKHIINHKNQDVAVQALNHPNVTPAVVQDAYNRKAADVSRAAADHPMATAEMKSSKIDQDPVAAAQMASDADHDTQKAIFEKHGKHMDVAKELIKNKNAHPEVLKNILKNDALGTYGNKNSRNWDDDLERAMVKNPNLDKDLRRHLLKTKPYEMSQHKDLQPDEMAEGLDHFKNGTDRDSGSSMSSMASRLLTHPNMSPELAKKIVTGNYGDGNIQDFDVNAHDHFTKDVVDAGMSAAPELVNHGIVSRLAQSKHLSPNEIKGHLNGQIPTGDDEKDFHKSKVNGLLQNKNVPKEEVGKILKGEHPTLNETWHKDAALASPNLDSNDLKDFVSSKENMGPKNRVDNLAATVKSHNLQEHALTNGNSNLVDTLINKDYGRGIHKEAFAKAMHHSDPEVVDHMIGKHGDKFANDTDEVKAQTFDHLAGTESAEAAFPYMSRAGKDKMTEGADKSDPFVIKNMHPDTVKQQPITADTDADAVNAIVNHPGASDAQLKAGADHSVEGADSVLNRLNIGSNSISRAGKEPGKDQDFLSIDEKDKLHQDILDKHQGPDSSGLVRKILRATNSPDTIQKVINRPDMHEHISAIADHKKTKSADLDKMKEQKGPEMSGAMGTLAAHPKSSVALLQHIAKNYPEHLPELASHDKAGSAKLLKTLVDHGDLDTHVNLANNTSTPQDVRNALLKNPKVLMAAKPEMATSEQLDEATKSDDLDMHKFVMKNPNATPDQRAVSLSYALGKAKSGSPEDTSKASNVISEGLKYDVGDSALEEIGKHDKDHVGDVLSNNGATPRLALSLMDHYKNDNDVLHSVAQSYSANDPAVMDKIIDNADFSHEGQDDKYLPQAISNQFTNRDSKHKDATIDKFYNKLTEARPADHKYKNPQAAKMDASAMKTVANKVANPEIQSKLVDIPNMAGELSQNNKLAKPVYDKLLDHLINNPSFKGASFNEEDSDVFQEMMDHKASDSASLDKMYDHITKNNPKMAKDPDLVEKFAKNKKISGDVAKDILKNFKQPKILSNPALPDADLKKAAHDNLMGGDSDNGHFIAKNPKFRLSMLDDADMNQGGVKERMQNIYKNLVGNNRATPEDIQKSVESYAANDFHKRVPSDMKEKVVKNPNAPEDMMRKWLKDGEISKEDAYNSPSIGGETWRAEKHEFPGQAVQEGQRNNLGLIPGKENNEATFRPREEKVKQVASMIPEGGSLVWANFKKENPSIAGDPIVQKLFTSAPKQTIDAAHADKYLSEMPAKKFHVSYLPWNGMQRHNKNTQTVFQLNNGEDQDKTYKADPNSLGLYKAVQSASERSGHPTNPQSIGWSRVDTSHPDHWFIDEIQSDYNSGLSKELDQLNREGRSSQLEKHGVEPDKAGGAINKLVDTVQGWDKALLNNIIETAKAHGAKRVSIHSGQSKTLVNKGQQSEVTNKYDKIYNKMPKDMGFQEDRYDSLPMGDKKSALMGQPIWTMHLDANDQNDKKNARREKLEGKVKDPKDLTKPEPESE